VERRFLLGYSYNAPARAAPLSIPGPALGFRHGLPDMASEQMFGAKQQDAHEEQSYLRMRRLDASYECSEDEAA
jgi:hypothetical protein